MAISLLRRIYATRLGFHYANRTIYTKSDQLLRDFVLQLRAIHIDHLERKWITISLLIIALLVGIITIDAFFHGVNPPSKVETIDSAKLHLSKEFAENNLGVQVDDKGDHHNQDGGGALLVFPQAHCRSGRNAN